MNNAERNLRNEIDELGIVFMEDGVCQSRESTFAALDAIREHNKQYPQQKLAQMIVDAKKEARETMAGIK